MSEVNRPKRPRKDVHPMRADANLPARMTKLARKALAKRRAEIEDEDAPTCDDVAEDALPLRGHAFDYRVATWETINAHNGCELRVACGNYQKLALGLNENAR